MRIQDLYDVRWGEVSRLAYAYLTNFDQKFGKDEAGPKDLVTGIAVLFILLCKRFNLDPRRVLETTDRVIRRAKDVEPQYVGAISMYLERELD